MISSAKTSPENPKMAADTTQDAFLGGRLQIAQPRKGHRAGSDAVFLAAAVPAKPGQSVLDAGAGAGVAGLCLLARVPDARVTAIEIDASQGALALVNAERNGFSGRFEAIAADLTAPAKALETAGLVREGYDHVLANPPFYEEGSVRATPDTARKTAHVMGRGELERWVRFLTTAAAAKGTVTVVHRADQLGLLLELLEDRFGDLAVYPLFPQTDEPAGRVIVQGRKNSRAKMRLLPGLVLHEPGGAYTKEAEAVLRGGAALSLQRSPAPRG